MSSLTLLLTSPAATVTAATDPDAGAPAGRELSGLALPYGPIGRTSAGPVTVAAGAVVLPNDLRRVKLFTEHGRHTPVGFALAADDTAAGLVMRFRVGATPAGDSALLEAAEGVRDALSVELDDVTITNGAVTSAVLAAVALVPLPAFADARLAASHDPGATGAPDPAPDPAEQPPATPDPDPSTDPTPRQEPTVTTTTTTTAPPTTDPPAGASLNGAATVTASGPASVTAAATQIATAMQGANGSAAALEAALVDITPKASGDAFMRPQWMGELWTPRAAQRPWMNLIGTKPLTSMTWTGWKWETYPDVADYAGNKTAIPSSPAKIVPADGKAERLAGGWDMDRIYEDFNTGFASALLDAATVSYGIKSEAKLAASLLAASTKLPGAAPDLTAALGLIIQSLIAAGASLDGVGMSADVYGAFLGLTKMEVPWWLEDAAKINLTGQTVDLPGVAMFCGPLLPAGTVIGLDKRAIDFRETGPFRLQALNLPNGGIDVALMGYQGQIVHDKRGIVSTTVDVPAPEKKVLTPPASKTAEPGKPSK